MNEPFFPLPIPREPENGLKTVLTAFLRRAWRRGAGSVSDSRLTARRPRPSDPGGCPPFPVLPPPIF